MKTKPDYGIDAPFVIYNLTQRGIKYILGTIILSSVLYYLSFALLGWLVFWVGISMSLSFLIPVIWMLYSSKIGKQKIINKVVQQLHLQGNEQVLDIGCGRGLFLNAVAKQLTTGKAVGIDIWQEEDQSNNSMQATLANAHAEGVQDKIAIQTADMRTMPFSDNTFDTVISCLAIHNIQDKNERAKALQEIDRVLKPGGNLALIDFQYTDQYAHELKQLGWNKIEPSKRYYQMFPPIRIILARKPH